MIVFNWGMEHWILMLQAFVAIVLPLLVALVTNGNTSSAVKAWLLAGLNVLAGLGAELLDALSNGTTYDLGAALVGAIGTFIIGVAMHYGLWKPTTVSGRLQSVGQGRHEA